MLKRAPTFDIAHSIPDSGRERPVNADSAPAHREEVASRHRGIFIGRERELGELSRAIDEAGSGIGGLVMIVGEPGIGKSRLVEEAASDAEKRRVRVLWGRCHEGEGAPVYWAWSQVLRACLREKGISAILRGLGAAAADLAQVVPELGPRIGTEEALRLDPEQARFRFFESVALFLASASRKKPLVLVLDDLHWADEPSLLLLRFLARELRDARVLIVGTYRQTELGRHHPLSRILGQLTETHRIQLRGLGEKDVGHFVESSGGGPVSQGIVSILHSSTGGNPFFLGEIVRILLQEGHLRDGSPPDLSATSIPQGIREVIGRRLDALSPECNRVLAMASVIGRELSLEVLARVAGRSGEELLDPIGEAVAAGILVALPRTAGRVAFSHALVRETLYQEISSPRRVALHGEIADALEELHGRRLEPILGELAFHCTMAAPTRDFERAVRYSIGAGAQATGSLAYEEAARQYERALELLEAANVTEHRRCEVTLALAEALSKCGETERARKAFLGAAGLAKAAGAPELLADAALGYGLDPGGQLEGIATVGHVDDTLVRLLVEALDALPAGESPLRARILARLAAASYWAEPYARRDELSKEALDMARRTNDPRALVAVLNCARYALLVPENVQERIEESEEMLRVAREARDAERELVARRWRVMDFLELGDVATADREIDAHARRSREVRHPFSSWLSALWEAMRALLEGRYDAAEAAAGSALSIGERIRYPHALSFYGAQMFRLWWERGDLGALDTAVTEILKRAPAVPAVRCAVAFANAELGRLDEARAQYELLAADGFGDLRHDVVWLVSLAMLVEVASKLEDRKGAGRLYELLLPYAWGTVVVGPPPAACYGPVAHYLGMAASIAGRNEDAARHFGEALRIAGAMGARPWVALTQYEHARAISEARPEEALRRIGKSLETATDLGMKLLAERAGALRRRLAGDEGSDVPGGAARMRAPSRNVFRREGDHWTIAYEGKTFRLRDAKGLRYLADLFSAPGRELHVSDLVAVAEAGSARASSGRKPSAPLGDAGEILDPKARAEYRRRLEELQGELEEAERFGDTGRTESLKTELEFLTNELAAGYGLGGRARKAADSVERARKAVTNRIRDRIVRIAEEHPALGSHLENSIRMGAFCSYSPEKPVVWEL